MLLSAQCTDDRVNLVTPKLFALADSSYKMIKLTESQLEKIIKPCGLSSRKAKAILSLSRTLIEKHEGLVPNSFEDLEALDGVGHKTASVIMIHCFKTPAFPVDTHIFRSAHRWGLSKGKNVVKVEEDLKKLFPKEKWEKLHLQMIYFARKYCPARGHKKEMCPICG